MPEAASRTISTHAPAGGATHMAPGMINFENLISTHAPAGGATRIVGFDIARISLFLLTPLREGRPRGAGAYLTGRLISTHAPAGGATQAD